MPDYQCAADKPDRTLINYNTTRAAELKAIHKSVVSDRTDQSIITDFAREQENPDNVKDSIDFLHAVDLVQRGGDDRVISPLNREIFPDLAFEPRLLYHLRQQTRPQDHLSRVQGVAVGAANRSITLDILIPVVKEALGGYDFKWNTTKLRMWRSMATQLGLVSETDSRGLILSPHRRLLYDLLALYKEYEGSNDLYDALVWIEENFFDVFETKVGSPTVHPAVSDVLQNMEAEEVLELRGLSDASSEVSLPESTHSQTRRTITMYEVKDLPETSSYQYPLAQFDQVIVQ